jgi:hypothetical protein
MHRAVHPFLPDPYDVTVKLSPSSQEISRSDSHFPKSCDIPRIDLHSNDGNTHETVARLGGAARTLIARARTRPAARTHTSPTAHACTSPTARTDATACATESIIALRYATSTRAATRFARGSLGKEVLTLDELVLSEVAWLWEAVESYLLMLSTCSTAGRPAGLLEAEIASERG